MDRKEWKLKRVEKDITITEIADAMQCSISLISKHENNIANMEENKVIQYQLYIENK